MPRANTSVSPASPSARATEQASVPDKDIPCSTFAGDVRPFENACGEQDTGAEKSRDSRIERGEDPEAADAGEYRADDSFGGCHTAHGGEFPAGEFGRFRGPLQGGRIKAVDEPWHERHADGPRDDSGTQPTEPGDGVMQELSGHAGGDGVAGLAGEQGCRDDADGLIDADHQECAELPGRFAGFRAVEFGDGTDDRKHDSAGAGAARRDDGGEDKIGQAERVADAEGCGTESPDKKQSDAARETGLQQRDRDEERRKYQPHHGIGITGEGALDGESAEERRERDGDQDKCAARDGLEDQSGNRRDEDAEQAPAFGFNRVGPGYQENDGAVYGDQDDKRLKRSAQPSRLTSRLRHHSEDDEGVGRCVDGGLGAGRAAAG